MKNLLLSAFCSAYATLTFAQSPIDALVKDPKNAWVVSFTSDIRLDVLNDADFETLYNRDSTSVRGGFNIMKIIEDSSSTVSSDDYILSENLQRAALREEINFYADKTCTQQLSRNVFPTTDTVDRIDPITYETKTIVVPRCRFYEVQLFRAYQAAYYQPETGTWGVQTLAIAPLISDWVREKDSLRFNGRKPIFWIKVNNILEKPNSEDITWAVRTFSQGKNGYLDLSTTHEYKNVDSIKPMKHFFDVIMGDKPPELYAENYSWKSKKLLVEDSEIDAFPNFGEPMPKDSIQKTKQNVKPDANKSLKELINARFINTYPNIELVNGTYEVVQKTTISSLTDKMQLVQEWFWDSRKQTLSVRLVGIAPTITKGDEPYRYYDPLFYQRFD